MHPLVSSSDRAMDVVGEVAKAQGGAAEVFEATVDRFGGAVGSAGARTSTARFWSVRPRGVSSCSAFGTPVPSAVISAAIFARPLVRLDSR